MVVSSGVAQTKIERSAHGRNGFRMTPALERNIARQVVVSRVLRQRLHEAREQFFRLE